jgi:hypothetical protein
MATTIRRTRALPELPKRGARCWAATTVEGASPECSGVLCGVIALDRAKADGIGMSPGQLAQARSGGAGDVFLSIEKDPSTVERLCCGDGMPVINDLSVGGNRESYTYCPVWQAEKERLAEGRDTLTHPVEPDSVATEGFDPADPEIRRATASDPFADADLELLTS